MENTADIKGTILKLERKYWEAMQNKNLEVALKLTDFPCVVAGSYGAQSVNKEQFTKMFQSTAGMVTDFKLDENKVEIRQLGSDTAVIAYQAKSTMTKDGKNNTKEFIDTSTWIRRNNEWACAMHTETELLPH